MSSFIENMFSVTAYGSSSSTYVNNGITRLLHIGNDAVRQNQQDEVVSAWHAAV